MHRRPRSSSSQFLHKSTISLFTLLHHQHRNFTTIHPVDTRNSNTFLLPISTPSQEQEHDPPRHLAQREDTDTRSTKTPCTEERHGYTFHQYTLNGGKTRIHVGVARQCCESTCRWSHDFGPRWEEPLTNSTTNIRRRTYDS